MQFGNNDNDEYEYTGSPKKQYITNLILSVLLALLMFWTANYYYTQLVMFENGETIQMQKFIYSTYKLVGKWPISIFFSFFGFGFLYAGYTHFKKYQEVKNQDF